MTLYALDLISKMHECVTNLPHQNSQALWNLERDPVIYLAKREKDHHLPKLIGPYANHTPERDQNRHDVSNNKLQ